MTFRQNICERSNNETIDILDNSEITRIKRDMLNNKSQIETICFRQLYHVINICLYHLLLIYDVKYPHSFITCL